MKQRHRRKVIQALMRHNNARSHWERGSIQVITSQIWPRRLSGRVLKAWSIAMFPWQR